MCHTVNIHSGKILQLAVFGTDVIEIYFSIIFQQ